MAKKLDKLARNKFPIVMMVIPAERIDLSGQNYILYSKTGSLSALARQFLAVMREYRNERDLAKPRGEAT